MIVIDRFEGDFVVVQDTVSKTGYSLSVTIVDEKAKEGDMLIFDNSLGYYVVDEKSTKTRAKQIKDKFNSLIAKD